MIQNTYRVIDSHCHIYPEKIAERASMSTSNFYGIPSGANGTVATLLQDGLATGIDHFIVQSVATTPKQVKSINEFIAQSVEEGNGLFTGLGTLHPDSDDLAADVRHLQELGLKGVKLHPDIQQFKIDDHRCLKIYELCERDGLPILMHTGDNRYDMSNPNRLLPILQIYSSLTIIGAHLGGYSLWEEASDRLAGTPNLYVDCSSSLPFLTPERAKNIIYQYGVERVLFGTDYPLFLPSQTVPLFMALGLSEEENRKILYDNAAKLYGIHP